MSYVLLILPSDLLRPKRPDEHFRPEAEAARDAGIDVALVDHDLLWRSGSADEAVGRLPPSPDAVYRGWMLRTEQYDAFAVAAAQRGAILRTSAEAYRRAHELPSWYDVLSPVTPETVWTDGAERDQFMERLGELAPGPVVLRDYTKSMKHYWHEAAFIPEAADADAAWRVATRFLELREDDFVGGLVLRRFERFTSEEIRTWWIDGQCAAVTAHPDTPDQLPNSAVDMVGLAPLVEGLGLPFVTVDLRLRADGVWRVIELGDGQVSDRPTTMAPGDLIEALDKRL